MWTSEHRRLGRIFVGVAIVSAVFAGCGSDDDGSSEEATLAQQLVDATHAAGVAPRTDRRVAESLYGTDASAVCDAFDGGLSTSAQNIILGNPGHGRRKTITDEAVEYGRARRPDLLPRVRHRLRRRRQRPRSVREERFMTERTDDRNPPNRVRGPASGAVAMVAWPALAMLMVASVGSIAQLSDSASFGLGAVTVYLLPALLFLLPVGLVSAELATSNRVGSSSGSRTRSATAPDSRPHGSSS